VRTAYLDEIRFIPVPEPGARVAGLQTGEYDFADFLPAPAIPGLSKDKNLKVVPLAPYNYPTLYFNHGGKFKELKLRQAVQAALNMAEILQVASDGNGRLDPGFFFKEQIWHSNAGAELYNQNDPAKAKQLLKDAGYNNEPFVMITNTDYDYMYKAALVVLQQLKKAGMNIKLEVYDWPGSLAVRKDLTKWDLFFSGHSTFYDPSGMNYYFLPTSTFFAYSSRNALTPLTITCGVYSPAIGSTSLPLIGVLTSWRRSVARTSCSIYSGWPSSTTSTARRPAQNAVISCGTSG
jgi:ABC-type transport system substrate-binding protein